MLFREKLEKSKPFSVSERRVGDQLRAQFTLSVLNLCVFPPLRVAGLLGSLMSVAPRGVKTCLMEEL